MKSLIFIIPDLHSKITGANKRAINLSNELSTAYCIVVVSAKRIERFINKELVSSQRFSTMSLLNLLFKERFEYWFCDNLRWASLPVFNLIFT